MAIYLTREYKMAIDIVGVAMSMAMVVGVLFSMGFGMLADRVDKNAACYLQLSLLFVGLLQYLSLIMQFSSLFSFR